MTLQELELYNITLSQVEPWIPQQKRTLAAMRKLLAEESLCPKERYELGSFYWCETFVGVFSRLEKIREMTNRSLYKRKYENKTELIKEWIVYNYHIYITIYQSVRDIALQLTNEILDLGTPEKLCNFFTIYNNRRVKDAGVDVILKEIHIITEEHREGKNLLLHKGKGVSPPIRMGTPSLFNGSDIAKNMGMDEEVIRAYLEEFLAVKGKAHLVEIMLRERGQIERQVEKLFSKLLPQYNRIHNFYEQ